MSALLALALTGALATAPEPPCPGETTQDMNQCYSERSDKADAKLARYVAAARARLKQEAAAADHSDPGTARAERGFETAEQAWASYRDAECGAVYDYWSGGTIRGVESLDCRIRLTRLHTHTIWRLWLTYMDSTPPLLPEPVVPSDDWPP
jgi:uncharacterized protein YecT (DUF1311 family)